MSIEREAARKLADIEQAKRVIVRAIGRLSDGSEKNLHRCWGLIDGMFFIGHIDEPEYIQYLDEAEKAFADRRLSNSERGAA